VCPRPHGLEQPSTGGPYGGRAGGVGGGAPGAAATMMTLESGTISGADLSARPIGMSMLFAAVRLPMLKRRAVAMEELSAAELAGR